MSQLHLVIGNKVYSSWSMRPWVLMTALGIAFQEQVIPLRQDDTKARILAVSPSGKVPVLRNGATSVWESLAIAEYLGELYPDAGVWPADAQARAHARSAAAEMHAGFQALRATCQMDIARRFHVPAHSAEVLADVARISALWREARQRFGIPSARGAFLYGAFSAADAMFAPVVSRFHSYGVPLDADAQAYCAAMRSHAAYRAWLAGALAEPWVSGAYDMGLTVVEDLRAAV